MHLKLTYLLFALGISMVTCSSMYACPEGCTHPKTASECELCLNKGYSDIVHGRTSILADQQIGKLLKPGAYTSMEGGRCWIHLLGAGSDNCAQVAKHLFGDGRCSGYEGHSFELTGKCWAKFNKG